MFSKIYKKDEEYCERFDDIRKGMMEQSFYKYGPVKANYGGDRVQAIPSLKRALDKYEETGNTEYLCDVANYAMIEFMFPKVKGAKYRQTGSDESAGIVGMSVREIEEFENLEK